MSPVPRCRPLVLFVQCAMLAVTLFAAGFARAGDPSRVIIVRPASPSIVLDEALIRTRGELRAVGFEIDERIPPLPREFFTPDVYGALTFEEVGPVVHVSAMSPDGGAALMQSLDTTSPGIDAEVVAVRAVETLRGAMLRFTQQADSARRRVPSPVRGFTRTDAPPAPAIRTPMPARRGSPGSSRRQRAALTAWLGPSLVLPEVPSEVGWGAQAGLHFGKAWYFAAASLETALVPARYVTDSGSAEVWRTFALLAFRTLIDLEESSVLSGAAGLGLASYSVRGRAEPGYDANQDHHESVALALEFGTARWLFDHLGVYLSLRTSAALDAAVIRIDSREIATLDRPALSLSTGVLIGRR